MVAPGRNVRRALVAAKTQTGIDRGQQLEGVVSSGEFRTANQRITFVFENLAAAIDCRHRRNAGHAAIGSRRKRINIGPVSLLFAIRLILFERRVAGRDQGRQSLSVFAQCLSRRSEINQQGVAGLMSR